MAKIPLRNLNYLRNTKEPIKPHLVAELFDDVNAAYGNHQDRIAVLEAQVAELTAKKKT